MPVQIKKSLHTTEVGINVSDFLIESDFCFIDLEFSSKMEEKLDCIAKGDCDKVETLKDFWQRLKSDIENAKIIKEEVTYGKGNTWGSGNRG